MRFSSNGGVFGSLYGTPIINLPQAAVLGMHAIKERPVVVNGQIVIRPIMVVALTYDHRLLDGREAVTFLGMLLLFSLALPALLPFGKLSLTFFCDGDSESPRLHRRSQKDATCCLESHMHVHGIARQSYRTSDLERSLHRQKE